MARLENLLAAQSLAVADRIQSADDAAHGHLPASARAALVTLLAHPDRPVSWLGSVLSLTSSGVTRLVTRLEADGLVARSPGTDARNRMLRLSKEGKRLAKQILAARESAVHEVVAELRPKDRKRLERMLETIIAGCAPDRAAADRMCRLCDRKACASAGEECPLEFTTHSTSP